jgi:hypothetical protein
LGSQELSDVPARQPDQRVTRCIRYGRNYTRKPPYSQIQLVIDRRCTTVRHGANHPRPQDGQALPGLGDRLPDRLSDGVRRDGGLGARRPLARAHLIAQTGHWAGRSRRGARSAVLKDVPKEIPQADIDRWSIESDMPVGRRHHLAPTVQLFETPLCWARPLVPLGHTSRSGPPARRNQRHEAVTRPSSSGGTGRRSTLGRGTPGRSAAAPRQLLYRPPGPVLAGGSQSSAAPGSYRSALRCR